MRLSLLTLGAPASTRALSARPSARKSFATRHWPHPATIRSAGSSLPATRSSTASPMRCADVRRSIRTTAPSSYRLALRPRTCFRPPRPTGSGPFPPVDATRYAVGLSRKPIASKLTPLFQAIHLRQCNRGDWDGKPLTAAEFGPPEPSRLRERREVCTMDGSPRPGTRTRPPRGSQYGPDGGRGFHVQR